MELMAISQVSDLVNASYDGEKASMLGNFQACLPLYNSYYYYWPNYCYHYEPNKFEQAFKILQKLIDKKLIEIKTVKQFIETLGDIQQVL